MPEPGSPRQGRDEAPAASVTVYPDGPLIVRGDFEVRTVQGETVIDRRTVALCRCGRSGAKPLCDGSHNFRSSPRAKPEPGDRDSGTTQVPS
jgi:CDGSH-type Zn-finger protein